MSRAVASYQLILGHRAGWLDATKLAGDQSDVGPSRLAITYASVVGLLEARRGPMTRARYGGVFDLKAP
jgi:hypothetical protein